MQGSSAVSAIDSPRYSVVNAAAAAASAAASPRAVGAAARPAATPSTASAAAADVTVVAACARWRDRKGRGGFVAAAARCSAYCTAKSMSSRHEFGGVWGHDSEVSQGVWGRCSQVFGL